MSTFDINTDTPGLLRAESINITLKFDRTSATTGRVSWNIPTPAAGCTAETQAYCGMVVTLDTKPAAAGKGPTDGTTYNSDPTADTNLFAGDKLDTALIIGAFYQDKNTTYFDVTGLKGNTPYYVSGFPADCQLRYFPGGVHAYSVDYTNKGTDGTNGSQVVVLNSSAATMGVQPTDATGLNQATPYDFKIQLGVLPRPNRPIDSTECTPTAPVYTISVNGTNAQTYDQLVTEINKRLGLLSNGAQGPVPPSSGTYYWNASNQKLFLWDGYVHVEVPVSVHPIDPTVGNVGSYWVNTSTGIVSVWDGLVWYPVPVIALANDPASPSAELSYWFDGTSAWRWNGTTWCQTGVTVQSTDPSLATAPPGGSYWYNPDDGVLYKWNNALEVWIVTTAVQSFQDPTTYGPNNYWLNETTNALYQRDFPLAGWNIQSNVTSSEIAPALPAPGKLWYNPTTMELFKRDLLNAAWEQQDVTLFPTDPSVQTTCNVWWDTNLDRLNVWNSVNSTWVVAANFFQQPNDPSTSPTISEGWTWMDTLTNTLYVWENNCFRVVSMVDSPTDPTIVAPGTIWYNPVTKHWSSWANGSWVSIDPVESPIDPLSPALGSFWFNTTLAGLSMWNGISWAAVMYSGAPLTPAAGTLWYDTASNMLKSWNGFTWVPATPIASVELDCNGNLLFKDNSVGSLSFVMITDGTLFKSLATTHTVHDPRPGSDGSSDVPSYSEIGIGTDGNDAMRNSIITDIRYELGYPVVDVELTKEQMDYAINRALSELRQRSSIAYKRGFFFMAVPSEEQRFFLTNKVSGMNKIVDVLGVYRLTSSFLSSAHGAGVYGQIVMQHLYNMGTFDLLSYHLMSEYTKLMEMLFAARVTYTWNEQTRELWLFNRFPQNERMVCIEATEERTEQDIMSDRYAKPWIRRYASATCRLMLAEIRGKYSTLPGAGGSITLNAGELRQAAQTEIEACIDDIENYVVDRPEEYGMNTTFTFG